MKKLLLLLLLLILLLISFTSNSSSNNFLLNREYFLSELHNIDLIYQGVYTECNTCNSAEQNSIIQVILNRIPSKRFPNTIEEIICQPYQFQGISSYKISNIYYNKKLYNKVEKLFYNNNNNNKSKNILFFVKKYKPDKYHLYPTWLTDALDNNILNIMITPNNFYHAFYYYSNI